VKTTSTLPPSTSEMAEAMPRYSTPSMSTRASRMNPTIPDVVVVAAPSET